MTAALAAEQRLPARGYFSIADTKAEVYSKAGEQFDPTKRPGRYKSDFIWNSNWQEALQRQEDLERQQADYKQRQEQGLGSPGGGALRLGQLVTLDDLSIDLTPQLLKKREPRPAAPPAEPRKPKKPKGAAPAMTVMPTRLEAKRYQRATRVFKPSIPVVVLPPELEVERAKVRVAEQERYDALKVEFQRWTLALGLLGCATCYFGYSTDIAASYSVGAAGGLLYLRLLTRSVDSVGEGSMGGRMNAAVGQPRLLIPVILTLLYNRWNKMYAEDVGIHLELIAMLLGFFTYKFAVLGRQTWQLLADFTADAERSRRGEGSEGSEEQRAAAASQINTSNIDRGLMKKIMMQ